MAYYDYMVLKRNKIGFGWINNSNRIKKPMALSLSQNITEYWAVELGNYHVPVLFKDSATEILSKAYDLDLKFMVISTLGVSYAHRYNFINEVGDFIDTHDDTDSITIIGHILDKKEKFYELHPQTFLINVQWWHDSGRPEFGNETYTPHELPVVTRSEENWHDDYTPHWIENSGETKTYNSVRRGWNIIKCALESGHKVYSFNQRLRDSKIFLYPEVANDTQRQYKNVFNAMQSYCHFVANTESPPVFNFAEHDFEHFDGALTTAGGLSPLLTAHALRMPPGSKLVIADISPLALIMQQKILTEKLDIMNYEKEMTTMLQRDFISYEKYGDLFLAKANMARMQEIVNKIPGLNEYYQNVYLNLDIEFKQLNFLDPDSTRAAWGKFSNCNKVFINLSNVFSYQNTSWLYTVSERYNFEKQLLEIIAKNGTDKYFVKSIRQAESWRGVCVDNILMRGINLPTVVKDFPWQT